MKKHLLTLTLLATALAAQGQNVHFNFTDGTQQSYTLEDVRKTTFTDDVMNLHLTDGAVYSWNVSTIDRYTFNEVLVTSISNEKGNQLSISRIYPNPTTGLLTVSYTLDTRIPVSIEVRDLQGRTVRKMDLGTQPAGANTVQWDGLDAKGNFVTAGTYLCHIITPQVRMCRTFIVL